MRSIYYIRVYLTIHVLSYRLFLRIFSCGIKKENKIRVAECINNIILKVNVNVAFPACGIQGLGYDNNYRNLNIQFGLFFVGRYNKFHNYVNS